MPFDSESPCVGICSTVYGDEICRGCKRTYNEVIDWNRFETTQKEKVYQRLDGFISQVYQDYVEILDVEVLKARLKQYHIAYRASQSAYCWVHALLRKSGDKIKNIQHYGVILKPVATTLSLTELFNKLDHNIYCLANAQYVAV